MRRTLTLARSTRTLSDWRSVADAWLLILRSRSLSRKPSTSHMLLRALLAAAAAPSARLVELVPEVEEEEEAVVPEAAASALAAAASARRRALLLTLPLQVQPNSKQGTQSVCGRTHSLAAEEPLVKHRPEAANPHA